jgi:hypothetical protein
MPEFLTQTQNRSFQEGEGYLVLERRIPEEVLEALVRN